MANVTASMENVAKTTLRQSNESSYLKIVKFNLLLSKEVQRKLLQCNKLCESTTDKTESE